MKLYLESKFVAINKIIITKILSIKINRRCIDVTAYNWAWVEIGFISKLWWIKNAELRLLINSIVMFYFIQWFLSQSSERVTLRVILWIGWIPGILGFPGIQPNYMYKISNKVFLRKSPKLTHLKNVFWLETFPSSILTLIANLSGPFSQRKSH